MIEHYEKIKISREQLLIQQNDPRILELLEYCDLDNTDLKEFNDTLYRQTQGKEDLFWYISDQKKMGTSVLLKILFMLYHEGIVLDKLCKYSKLLLSKTHVSKVSQTIYSYQKVIDMQSFAKIYNIYIP